jgi:hypothetical protein
LSHVGKGTVDQVASWGAASCRSSSAYSSGFGERDERTEAGVSGEVPALALGEGGLSSSPSPNYTVSYLHMCLGPERRTKSSISSSGSAGAGVADPEGLGEDFELEATGEGGCGGASSSSPKRSSPRRLSDMPDYVYDIVC